MLLVIRLCTSEDAVVKYWNNIDSQLEIDVDVLDDQAGVYKVDMSDALIKNIHVYGINIR